MAASDTQANQDAGNAQGLSALAVSRPLLVIVANLLILIAGAAAILGVEVRELPDVDRPTVTVRAYFDGASPETMDAEVTSVIEGAVARVNGIDSISAASEENNMRVRARFLPTVDLDVAANDIREAVAGVERRLPEGVEDIRVVKADADASAIIRLGVVSDTLSQDALTRLVEDDIVTELAGIPGVASVDLFGDQEEVLRIVIDPIRLASFDLTIDDVSDVMRGTSLDIPAGSFKSDDHMLLVRADASVWEPSDIEALMLRDDVRLGMVARAFYGPADAFNYVRINGKQIVGVGIVRRAQANTIDISDGVAAAISRIERRLTDIEIVTISDDAHFIRSAVQEVAFSLMIAVGIVIGVIYLFVGSWRPTLLPAAAIPVALTGTLAAIYLLGFSINIMTLLALVLATGIIVDDAIVVVENIDRQRRRGIGSMAAAVLGTRQVFFAVIATTATLVSVFLPIAFLPSQAGRMFTEFGFVLAIAVAISSFVALTLVPMLAARLPDDPELRKGADGSPNFTPIMRALRGVGHQASNLYGRILDWVLAARTLVTGGMVLVAIAAIGVFTTLDEQLLPREDRGEILIYMQGPDGVGLEYMDRQAVRAEAILTPYLESGEVQHVFSIVGRWDPNRVFLAAPLVDWEDRDRTQDEIVREIRQPLREIPGATARVRQPNSLGLWRSGGRIEFALTGPRHQMIAAAANDFLELIEQELPGIENPDVEFQQTQPQLTVQVDRRRAEDLGVDVEEITATLRAMVDGLEVTELNVNDRSIPVLLESSAGSINDPGDLQNLFVRGTEDSLIPLSAFITLEEQGIAAELDRTGQRRAVEIDAGLAEGYTLRQAMADIEQLAAENLPPNIGLRFINEAASLDKSSNQVAITFLIAILVVFLVLAAQFESLLSALVIVLTVPFGLAAAVFSLALSGVSINIYSQIGLVMLVGLMAKNGILVVEFADQLRDRGMSVAEAIRESALVRLRPVMMTMISTVLGALPLILATGAGAEARLSIGWVVFGGLGLATVFTLFLIPVLYSVLAPLSPPRAHAGVRLARELHNAELDGQGARKAA